MPKQKPKAAPRNSYRQGKKGLSVYLLPEDRRLLGMATQHDGYSSISEWLISLGLTRAREIFPEKQ